MKIFDISKASVKYVFYFVAYKERNRNMATKLKNLKVHKVDFVDAGANPDAHIGLFKSRGRDAPAVVSAEEPGCEKDSGILKRLVAFIAKAAGMGQEEIDGAVEEIQKGDSVSFSEKINQVNNRKIADEIWDMCYALQSSLCSILYDEDLDSAGAEAAMLESLQEFQTVMQVSVKQWAGRKSSNIVSKRRDVSGEELEIMKAEARLAGESAAVDEDTKQEGEQSMGMKIDKSKMTPAERAFYEDIEKRCGVEEGAAPASGAETQGTGQGDPAAAGGVTKSAAQPAAGSLQQPVQPETGTAADDIYKGLHPAVRAELEGLKKFREAAEDRELSEVAKKYAVIGKKEEELVPLLKSLKAAGGTAYNDMLAMLDQTVTMVEKSGIFSEIGKSGHGGSGTGSAEAKIEGIAKGYMEKDPALSYNAAIAKAWENNPDILGEYDDEAGF